MQKAKETSEICILSSLQVFLVFILWFRLWVCYNLYSVDYFKGTFSYWFFCLGGRGSRTGSLCPQTWRRWGHFECYVGQSWIEMFLQTGLLQNLFRVSDRKHQKQKQSDYLPWQNTHFSFGGFMVHIHPCIDDTFQSINQLENKGHVTHVLEWMWTVSTNVNRSTPFCVAFLAYRCHFAPSPE